MPIVLFDLHFTGPNVAFSFFPVFIDSSAPSSPFVPFIQGEEIGADNPRLKTTRADPHAYKYGFLGKGEALAPYEFCKWI